MYSTHKNIILKKLRFVIAGIMLITILPGNAGENSEDMKPDIYGLKSSNHSIEFVSPSEVLISPDSSLNNISKQGCLLKSHSVSRQNCREISPTCKSFNLYTNIQ